MDDDNLVSILDLLNQWWTAGAIPPETLQARIVMIYKKGDTSKMENYRPTALLNSTYKIYAAIIQRRLADQLDPYLQKMQYGFRAKRGTAQALQCVRRMAEAGETKGQQVLMVLLDWEKNIR